MTIFHVVLTTGMFLLPGIVTSFYRPRPGESDPAEIRKRRFALWLATAACFVVYGFLYFAERQGWLAFWRRLPWAFRWSESPADIAWTLEFVLWFPFAVRLLAALRPESENPWPDSPRRTASLAARSPSADLPRGSFIPGWVLLGFATALVLVRAVRGAPPAAVASWWPCALFLGAGAFPLVFTPFALRLAAREPEPMDAGASPELAAAYARLRRLKMRGFAGLAIASSVLFAGIAVGAAWLSAPALLGVAGGVGGSVVGLGGAAFGILAGNERMRIRRRLDELASG